MSCLSDKMIDLSNVENIESKDEKKQIQIENVFQFFEEEIAFPKNMN